MAKCHQNRKKREQRRKRYWNRIYRHTHDYMTGQYRPKRMKAYFKVKPSSVIPSKTIFFLLALSDVTRNVSIGYTPPEDPEEVCSG